MAKKPVPAPTHPTYEQALQRLEAIVRELEEGHLDLDALVDKVREAGELVRYCRDRLKGVSTELDELLGSMEDENE